MHPGLDLAGRFGLVTLDLNFIEHRGREVLLFSEIIGNGYFHDLDDLFPALTLDFLLDLTRSLGVCCPFEHVLPFVVCTSNVKHRLEIAFFHWVELDRDRQDLSYRRLPGLLLSFLRNYSETVVVKLLVLNLNLHFFLDFLRVWVLELYYLQARRPAGSLHLNFLNSERLESDSLDFVAFGLKLFSEYFQYAGVFSFLQGSELHFDFGVGLGRNHFIVLQFKVPAFGKFALDSDGVFQGVCDLEGSECGFVDFSAESLASLFNRLNGGE